MRAEYHVIAADLFADADLGQQCKVARVTPYPEGFEAWLAETSCDAWLYTGALENYPDLVDRLSVSQPLLGHAGEVLRRVRDPMQLQTNLRYDGFDFPETQLARTAKLSRGSWISKTYQGSCGSGVGRDDAPYLQRRVNGTPLSAAFAGEKLLGITRQLVGESWSGADEFQYCGSIGRYPLSPEQTRHLEDLGKMLCATFGLTSLYGVDLIDDGETLWVIEVNPRYTASMEIVERTRKVSVIGYACSPPPSRRGARGGGRSGYQASSPLPSPPQQREGDHARSEYAHFGKAIMFAKAPLKVTAAMSDQLLQQAGDLPWPKLADIPHGGSEIETGQPMMTVFAEGNSCEGVTSRLRERVTEIEQQLYGRVFLCD